MSALQTFRTWVVQSGTEPVEIPGVKDAAGWLYNYGPGVAMWGLDAIHPGEHLTVKFSGPLIVKYGGGEIFAHGVFIQTHGVRTPVSAG